MDTTEKVNLRTPVHDVKGLLDGMNYKELKDAARHIHRLLNNHTPLLKLPPELRNQIYAHVIRDHLNEIEPTSAYDKEKKPHFIPKLFEASQQLRAEGRSLVFGKYIRVARATDRIKWREHSTQHRSKYTKLKEFSPEQAQGFIYKPQAFFIPPPAKYRRHPHVVDTVKVVWKRGYIVYRTMDAVTDKVSWRFHFYEYNT